jgi:hypothetical protein
MTVLTLQIGAFEMRGSWSLLRAGCMVLLIHGCASQSPMEQRLHEMRRQVEMDCMRTLMAQGMPLKYFGESMMTHCREASRRTVRVVGG